MFFDTKILNYSVIVENSAFGLAVAGEILKLGFTNIILYDFKFCKVDKSQATFKNVNSKVHFFRSVEQLQSSYPHVNFFRYNSLNDVIALGELGNTQMILVYLLYKKKCMTLKFYNQLLASGISIMYPIINAGKGFIALIQPQSFNPLQKKLFRKNFSAIELIQHHAMYMKFWGESVDWVSELNKNQRLNVDALKLEEQDKWYAFLAAESAKILVKMVEDKNLKPFPNLYKFDLKFK